MWLSHYHCKVLNVDDNFVEATHDGYRMEGVEHVRRVEFNRDENEITITDMLRCSKPAEIEIPFHLHPAVSAEIQGSVAVLSVAGIKKVQMGLDPKLSYAIRDGGWYSEHFGEKTESSALYAKTNVDGFVSFETKIKVLE